MPRLDAPINPNAGGWPAALEKLQGNILKSHGRDFSAILLIRFRQNSDPRQLLRTLAQVFCTSAAEQQRQADRFRNRDANLPPDESVFGSLCLSASGYGGLGLSAPELAHLFGKTFDPAQINWFLTGMQHQRTVLGDPSITQWDQHWQMNVDALLLLASDSTAALERSVDAAKLLIGTLAYVQGMERGQVIRNAAQERLEMFGFRDGISQPTFFESDPEPVQPSTALLHDPLASGDDAFGSYMVFRKLEQNVKAFRDAEEQLANDLALAGSARDRAGAMIVGRFRDGTPLVTHCCPANAPANNFDYLADAQGLKCPVHAHIRKVRHRPVFMGVRQIVRRGVPYGTYDPCSDKPFPSAGSGLLFMSFQQDIARQFGTIQANWANANDFPANVAGNPFPGPDPVLGQNDNPRPQSWPTQWGAEPFQQHTVGNFVTMKGGEFFFAPSLSFLKSL